MRYCTLYRLAPSEAKYVPIIESRMRYVALCEMAYSYFLCCSFCFKNDNARAKLPTPPPPLSSSQEVAACVIRGSHTGRSGNLMSSYLLKPKNGLSSISIPYSILIILLIFLFPMDILLIRFRFPPSRSKILT